MPLRTKYWMGGVRILRASPSMALRVTSRLSSEFRSQGSEQYPREYGPHHIPAIPGLVCISTSNAVVDPYAPIAPTLHRISVRFQTSMPPNRPLLLCSSDSPPVHSQMDWFYWYKFMWKGRLIREPTKQGNDKVARNMESAHRTSLAKGEVGIGDKKPAPTLTQCSGGA